MRMEEIGITSPAGTLDEYRVSALSASDREEAIALMKRSLGDDAVAAKTDAYWSWKHERSVFGPSYVTGARANDNTLASLRVMMRWAFAGPSGEQRVGVRPVDTATHPDHQRKGLFKRLTLAAIDDLRAEGAAFVFNTPNSNSRPGYLKMGWSVVTEWPLYARPASPLTFFSRPASPSRGVERWGNFAKRAEEDIRRIVAANEAGRARSGWRTIRTFEYLDWRYGDVPSLSYEVVPIEADGRLAGFVIGRSGNGIGGVSVFVVTEAFTDQPSVGAFAMLLRRTARRVRTAYLIGHFAEGTMERASLAWAGFLRMPKRGYIFAARTLDPLVSPDPLHPDSWDLTIGELEIF